MADPIIPTVVTQVVATVSGAIVSVGIPLVLTKLNKLNTLHTTVFGLQEVSTVGGLTDQVERNKQERIGLADQVGENTEDIKDIKENQKDLKQGIQDIKDNIGTDN